MKSIVLGALNMACFFPSSFVAGSDACLEASPGDTSAAHRSSSQSPRRHRLGESAWRLIWGVAGVVGIALSPRPSAQLDASGGGHLGGAADGALSRAH